MYPILHVQSVTASLPAAEMVLAGHAKQSPDPIAVLYVPASHATHATPSDCAVYPAMHTQSVSALLPGAETVLAGHAEQLPVPVAALYVPASHAKHSTPFDVAVYPATHVQSVSAPLPAAELVLAGHVVMVVPPGHHDPASHVAQESPPDP